MARNVSILQLVSGMKYAAPHKTAELAAEMFQDKSNVRVLDLACGTGLVAESVSTCLHSERNR